MLNKRKRYVAYDACAYFFIINRIGYCYFKYTSFHSNTEASIHILHFLSSANYSHTYITILVCVLCEGPEPTCTSFFIFCKEF